MQYREEEEEEFTDGSDDEEGFEDDDEEEGFENGSDDEDEGFENGSEDEEEGFENGSDSEEEGFENGSDSDSENEGFFSSLFEGFKTKSKSDKSKKSKSGKSKKSKTGKSKKSKSGKSGKSKKSKSKMARALTNAQIEAKNAQKQMEINNISLGNAQKHMADMKSSIMKQVSDVDAKDFNKISLPKKSSSLVFFGFALVATMIVFALYYMKYSAGHIADIIADKPTSSSIFMTVAIIAIILAVISFLLVIFKGAVMKTDIKQKNVLSIVTSVITIGLPIMAITLMTIENLPLMMRSFENTFGFSWIGGDKLKELTQKIFGGNGNYNDYSIISTQLFEENFKYYLTCMKKDAPVDPNINLNRFKNVFVDNSYFDEKGKIKMRMPDEEKPDDKVQDLYDLLSMVVRKRHISVATWVSLGTIVTMYASYLFL